MLRPSDPKSNDIVMGLNIKCQFWVFLRNIIDLSESQSIFFKVFSDFFRNIDFDKLNQSHALPIQIYKKHSN